MEDKSVCDTTLDLCLGLGNREKEIPKREIGDNNPRVGLELSFTFGNSKGAKANNLEEFQAGHEGSRERRRKKRVVESVNDEGSTSGAKKMRLTKEQSTILDECFKVNATPTSEQKQTLAEQLNIMPRQVEIWFQNRRARTKLRQTQKDFELLKKSCQILTEENTNLKRELQELRSLKIGVAPIYVHHITRADPANTTTSCTCGMTKAC